MATEGLNEVIRLPKRARFERLINERSYARFCHPPKITYLFLVCVHLHVGSRRPFEFALSIESHHRPPELLPQGMCELYRYCVAYLSQLLPASISIACG